MKPSLLKNGIFLAALPVFLWAQPAPATSADLGWTDVGPLRGIQELTFGGSGGSNRNLSDSFGGATASYGVYLNDNWQAVLRQSLNYINPGNGGSTRWNGSTRVAADFHFNTTTAAIPFIGASLGRIYGTALRDTWSGGLEAGVKYYLQRRVFVFGLVEYNWLFQRTKELDNNFGDGQLYWSFGVGFNF